MASRRRQVLSEFIAVRIPTRDRHGKVLSSGLREQWIHRIKHCLLHDLDIGGLEEDLVVGLWRGEYDTETDEFRTVSEECLVVKAFCAPAQMERFTARGEELLLLMGKAMRQQAVAYETREGLIVIYCADERGGENGV